MRAKKIPNSRSYYLKNGSGDPTFLMQKLIQQLERNACAKFKKNCGVEIFKLGNFQFFFNFLTLLCVIKRFLSKKYGVTGLVFKIDAINGKKRVKFVAMQQDSATLIYDLNAMKGTVESYLKK